MSEKREHAPRSSHADRYGLGIVLLCGIGVALAGASPRNLLIPAYLAGAIGIVALHERLRSEFPRSVAFLASLLIFAATSLFWFMVTEPAPLLTTSVAVLSIASIAAHRWTYDRPTRHQVIAAALLALLAIALAILNRQRDAVTSSMLWTDVLFSSANGFLSWSPVAYMAVIGTMLYAVRNRVWGMTALVTVIGMSTLVSSAQMLPALVLLAPGLAFLIDRVRVRPVLAVAPLVAAAVWWNYLLMAQYSVGILPKDEPVSFGGMVRQQAEIQTQSPYFYPFAFPMNVWFAWREGLPVDRYDLLAFEPRSPAIDFVLDRRADRFLLDGWDAPGADPDHPSWWLGGRRATIAVPLALDGSRGAVVSVLARTRYEEPVVEAELSVEINGHDIGRFVASPTAPSTAEFKLPREVVGRIMRAGYNRLTFVSHGVRRIDPLDQRPPGPLASRSGNRAWPVAIYRIRIAPTE